MSVALTDAGAALIAQLQAASQPLTIDTMVFANVPDQDFTAPIDTAAGIPAGVVHEAGIPPEYRAFVNPNQIVYSALLGSTVGPFSFNWQGLYCSEHDTLVAVATFPPLEKRAYDPNTNTPGNNLTRNFMLVFTGAQELTQITVEAAVWQLDFTVRLKGIDERERLAMRDLCGRAVFLDDGWLLTNNAGAYHFEAGHGFVEGIRAALSESLPVAPSITPCDVWLDVSLQPQGSDVVTVVTPVFLAPGASNPDYSEAAPYHIPHYCVRVASIAANGAVTDLRPNRLAITHEHIGAAAQTDLDAHEARTDNPHGVTKAQVGLGNLPNAKSDAVNLDSSSTLASSRAVRIVRDAQLGTQGEVDALEALIAGYEDTGQIGRSKQVGVVDFDTLTEVGVYGTNGGSTNRPPRYDIGYTVRVTRQPDSGFLEQMAISRASAGAGHAGYCAIRSSGDGGEPRVQIRTSDGYMGTVRYPGSSWATYEEDVTVNAFGATIEVWGLSDSQYDSRLCETQLFRISVGRWALRTGIVLH